MRIVDDGTKLTITSEPWLFARGLTAVFALLAVAFPIMLVASLLLPPRMAHIDCDRARGSCELGQGHWTRTVPLADLLRADVVHRRATKNTTSSHTLVVRTRDGQAYEPGDASYHESVTAGYRRAAEGLNGFLASPELPAFKTSYVASDTDWVTLIAFALISPLMAWIFLRLLVSRRIEVDRAARTLLLVSKRSLAGAKSTTVGLAEITGLRVAGRNWVSVAVVTAGGEVEALVVPRASGQSGDVREALRQLAVALAVPIDASAELRALWRLP
jgi:hypothetical protein